MKKTVTLGINNVSRLKYIVMMHVISSAQL